MMHKTKLKYFQRKKTVHLVYRGALPRKIIKDYFLKEKNAQLLLVVDIQNSFNVSPRKNNNKTHCFEFRIHHLAPETNSKIFIRAAAFYGEKISCLCSVRVPSSAKDVETSLFLQGMQLGQSSWIQFQPNFELEENSVTARHGASISTIPAMVSFFLASRGCSKKRIQKIILSNFFSLPE